MLISATLRFSPMRYYAIRQRQPRWHRFSFLLSLFRCRTFFCFLLRRTTLGNTTAAGHVSRLFLWLIRHFSDIDYAARFRRLRVTPWHAAFMPLRLRHYAGIRYLA